VAVKIRLRRVGKVHVPYYRIVVTDSRTKRDGRFIEQIGKYHPKEDPSYIEVDSDRAQYWLGVGAQPSDPVRAILQKTGDWQKFKGEPAPEQPLLQPKSRRNRDEVFNEALKEAGSEPKSEATTAKKSKKKADAKDADAAGDAPKADAKDPDKKADAKDADAAGDAPKADAKDADKKADAKDADAADDAPKAEAEAPAQADAKAESEAGDDASTS
jgi:small subunit ribosomal protein S16